jgi:LacI family transcriptional regulator
VRNLLTRTRDFTALFCFNDTSALGAIRAIQDAGLAFPHDISVIGFDDIIVAEYFNPRLTTVRQPLYKMSAAAAEFLIKRILSPDEPYPHDVCFELELIVRESTMAVHEASPPRPSRGKR